MTQLEPVIRNAVRAVIIRQQQILLLRKSNALIGECLVLPGGAQEPGETLHDALARECREEIGAEVRVEQLLHVADWLKPRSSQPGVTRHLLEFLFACQVTDDYRPANGPEPDKHQLAVEWHPLAALDELPLQPASLAEHLQRTSGTTYLGLLY